MRARRSPQPGTVPVQSVLVALSALLVPILVTAFFVLYVRPDLGAEYFAWPISPRMSSMMLGATYMGGAYFFLVVVYSRQWRHVWLGFLPVSAFAATMGLATLAHWDLFVHDRFGFLVWAVLYFAVPFVLPALWYRNRQLAVGADVEPDRDVAPVIRRGFGGLGTVLTVAGLTLFLAPDLMAAAWPWQLSPLTARVMAAIYLLPGLFGIALAAYGTWDGTRYLLQALAVSIALMLVAVVVARADFDWSRPTSWLFAGGLLLILGLVAFAYRTEVGIDA